MSVAESAILDDLMTYIPAGSFTMGSDRHYAEEAPARSVYVPGFWIDRYPVTNQDFARFVDATGYVTCAERHEVKPADEADATHGSMPSSWVFTLPDAARAQGRPVGWNLIPGACWRSPGGPGTSLEGLMRHPVVQVAFEDAAAYASWRGKSLPNEAEWECAARGGLTSEAIWDSATGPDGCAIGNIWEGVFPTINLRCGPPSTSEVGQFPVNPFGLYDALGNVWEWTSDWYLDRHSRDACCAGQGGSFDSTRREKVVKGGSFLCSREHCFRFRPAARQPQPPQSATNHIGFRCIVRGPNRAV